MSLYGYLSKDTLSIIINYVVESGEVDDIFNLFNTNHMMRNTVCYVLDNKQDVLFPNVIKSNQKDKLLTNFRFDSLFKRYMCDLVSKDGNFANRNYLLGDGETFYDKKHELTKICTIVYENKLINVAIHGNVYDSFCKKIFFHNMSYPEKFLERYADKILTENTKFKIYNHYSEKLLNKYREKFSWKTIEFTNNYSEKFVKKHYDRIDKSLFAKKYKFSYNFLIDFAFQNIISTCIKEYNNNKYISYKFLSENKSLFDWCIISQNIILNEKKIKKYNLVDYFNWANVSRNPSLYSKFLLNFSDKILWCYVQFEKLYISDKQLKKIITHIRDKPNFIFLYFPLTIELITYIRKLNIPLLWDYISENYYLSDEFIEEYKYHLNFSKLEKVYNQKQTNEFLYFIKK
jgi:hypothetical protein